MSKTRFLLFAVTVIALMSFTGRGHGKKNPFSPTQLQASMPSDTTEQKTTGDKAQSTAASTTEVSSKNNTNLESGFKDLFVMTGSNGVKLNSRAV